MPFIHEDICEKHDLDTKKVSAIAMRISRAVKEANAMGLIVFGGAGSGDIRMIGSGSQNIVADLDGRFDGGDGGDAY